MHIYVGYLPISFFYPKVNLPFSAWLPVSILTQRKCTVMRLGNHSKTRFKQLALAWCSITAIALHSWELCNLYNTHINTHTHQHSSLAKLWYLVFLGHCQKMMSHFNESTLQSTEITMTAKVTFLDFRHLKDLRFALLPSNFTVLV